MHLSELIIPLLNCQKFELKNLDTKERQVGVDVFSSRFTIVEEKNGEKHEDSKFLMTMQPKQSYLFEIKDKGPIGKTGEYNQLEGVLQIMVSEDPVDDKDCEIITYHFLPRLFLCTDPETLSYKKIKDSIWRSNADYCNSESDEANPLDKLITLEAYGTVKSPMMIRGRKLFNKGFLKNTPRTACSSEEEKKLEKKDHKHPAKKTSSSTTSTSEILPKPTKAKPQKSAESKSMVEEITPKSFKLDDVVFSDRPPKVSPKPSKSAEAAPKSDEKKSKIASVQKEPPSKSRKLDDVLFVDKPKKGPSSENILKLKGRVKSPIKSPVKNQEKKEKKKGKKGKCIIS